MSTGEVGDLDMAFPKQCTDHTALSAVGHKQEMEDRSMEEPSGVYEIRAKTPPSSCLKLPKVVILRSFSAATQA